MILLVILVGLFIAIAWWRRKPAIRTVRGIPAAHRHQKSKIDPSVQQVADTIKNRSDYRAARQKLERMESRSYATSAAQDHADQTINLLREALTVSEDKSIRHQLIVEPSVFVHPDALACAFDILDFDDPRRARDDLEEPGESYWNDMDDYDEPEPKPPWLGTLRDLVNLLHAPGTIREKMAAVDTLAKRKPTMMDEILRFDFDNGISAGEAWRIEVLSSLGCPKAELLVREGTVTLQDVLTVDPLKFGERKGVGPKTVAALVEMQAAIRAGEVTEPFSGA